MRTFVAAAAVATVVGDRGTLRLSVNPITRVCGLLSDLAKKLETEGKEEKKSFAKFECWCTKVEQSKTASIADAESVITEKEGYISELDSGRVELTDERTRLETEIGETRKQLKILEDDRKEQVKTYDETKADSETAIQALDDAIKKLETGAEFAEVSETVSRAMWLGEHHIDKQDWTTLKKDVLDQNPDGSDYDNKKLNKKATHLDKYDTKNGRVKKVLVSMKKTFEQHLSEIEKEETEHKKEYDDLHGSKTAELDSALEAQEAMAEEKAARAKAKTDAQNVIDSLTTQKEDDEKFKTQTKTTCETKAGEFEDRQTLRMEEVADINKAISILRSDDARDAFKKSFDSQTFVQLQATKARKCSSSRVLAASKALLKASPRLQLFALEVQAISTAPEGETAAEIKKSGYDEIIKAIDEMVEELHTEADDDIKKKDDCNEQRSTKTAEAKELSKDIDTSNSRIEELITDVNSLKETINKTQDEIDELNEELRQAKNNRDIENAHYQEDKMDDQVAKGLVEQVLDVLKARYESASLAAVKVTQRAPKVEAGKAPPPPPEVPGEYEQADGAGKGILAILETIKEDIEHDISKADKEEEDSVTAYDEMKKAVEKSIGDKESLIGDMEGEIGDKEGEKSDKKGEVETSVGELDAAMGILKTITPGCDFIAQNFELRVENRNAEIDGLKNAKAILQGANLPGLVQC